jgi:putative oxidoreductase
MRQLLALPAILTFAVVIAKFFRGVALVLGLLSRIAAVGIGITMLFAILMVHGRYGLFLNWFDDWKGHGYEYHLLTLSPAAPSGSHGDIGDHQVPNPERAKPCARMA